MAGVGEAVVREGMRIGAERALENVMPVDAGSLEKAIAGAAVSVMAETVAPWVWNKALPAVGEGLLVGTEEFGEAFKSAIDGSCDELWSGREIWNCP